MMTEIHDGDSDDKRFLILMRHAKSDWSDESLGDHDRPLNPRGNRDAPRMARWLAEVDMIPDVLISSTAQRTRETAALLRDEWPSDPEIIWNSELYLASPDSILRVIRTDNCDARRLLVLAHNPGMAQLVSGLAEQAVDMPTAAIAVFELDDTDWSEFRPHQRRRLIHYMRPKAL